jgi:ubiquinone biosynthesis protein
VDLVNSVVHRDEVRAVQVLLRMTEWEQQPGLRQFERDVADFMSLHLYQPLGDIQFARLLHDLLELASQHRLRIPPDIFMMLKALTTVEGIGRSLDPRFDLIAAASPFVREIMLERLHPRRLAADLSQMLSQFVHFIDQFPQDVLELNRQLRQHQLVVPVELTGLSAILASHDQGSNRLAFAIIIAALIIGSALIVISEIPPLFYGISLIGLIGFLAAALMGVWLLWAIIRRGKL